MIPGTPFVIRPRLMPTTPPQPFSAVTGIADETRTSVDYKFENQRRGRADEAVIQQTLAGEGWFEDSAGRRAVASGRAMLFTHDEASRYGYPEEAGGAPYRLRYLSFRLGALAPWFERLKADFGSVPRLEGEGEAAALMIEIGRRFHARDFRDRFHESELLHRLLLALYREQVADTQTRDPVEFGYHHLRDNFRSPLNLKQLAARCGISREHFIRAFGKRYGEPPGAMLRRLRLEQAQRMLRATQIPVQDVALACGFADANSFCRAYRIHFGTTPGGARREPPVGARHGARSHLA